MLISCGSDRAARHFVGHARAAAGRTPACQARSQRDRRFEIRRGRLARGALPAPVRRRRFLHHDGSELVGIAAAAVRDPSHLFLAPQLSVTMPRMRHVFYVFYPSHLLVLWIITKL
ncbi:hypothetical protein HQN59_18120 [Schlegelella sp. ID0723]|uniref:Uncharacterized protein n=1 Tax=Piscinibacter koreensis TaxID=2742824 RepID=A0A7Y6TXZ5_9BURK|nr:hypothetical protein [Schlegelella koreensis]